MADHLHFTRDLIATRNRLPGLRAEGLNVFFVSNSDRVIAFHRWVPGAGQDVVVVASLNESTHWNYQLGMPLPGLWREAFNSDAYDSASTSPENINPLVAGNRGSIHAGGPALHDLPFSATLVIPANGILVFTSGTR
jgi:1,4-alpha-glucan branching enzyme